MHLRQMIEGHRIPKGAEQQPHWSHFRLLRSFSVFVLHIYKHRYYCRCITVFVLNKRYVKSADPCNYTFETVRWKQPITDENEWNLLLKTIKYKYSSHVFPHYSTDWLYQRAQIFKFYACVHISVMKTVTAGYVKPTDKTLFEQNATYTKRKGYPWGSPRSWAPYTARSRTL